MNGLLVFIEMKQKKIFLQYGWFLQNLGKDFIRTNMHTTIYDQDHSLFDLEYPSRPLCKLSLPHAVSNILLALPTTT